MNCHDIHSLTGPYLDSELDVKTNLEIQQHLTACAACTRWFEAEKASAERLERALREGEATPALWKQTQQLVRAAAYDPLRSVVGSGAPATSTSSAGPGWRAWLWPNPQFYAGLAVAWVVMLTVHLLTNSGSERSVRPATPRSPEAMRVLAEQRRELVEMLGHNTVLPAMPTMKPDAPQPQSRLPLRGDSPGPANGAPNILQTAAA